MCSRFDFFRISPIGLGMAGAFVHNMVQINLAYLILIRLPEIFFLIPWLAFGALVFGAFSGSIATGILRKLIQNKKVEPMPVQPVRAYENNIYQPGDSVLHKCRPEIKFILVLSVTLLVVLKENLQIYAILFAGILVLIPGAGLGYKSTFQVIKKLGMIILSSFLLPLYFNPGTHSFIETKYFSLHWEAFTAGSVFGARIILLALLSSIMAQTTKADAITKGIKTFLKPFDRVGMNSDYIARTISLSMLSLPHVWHEIRSVIQFLLKGKKRSLKTLRQAVIQLFVYIFSDRNSRP
jgi:energy-coupling factor transporter transmembrane protein EcfT